ncbi:MAG: hypothetical protein IPJ65_07465 [Archangiaceae bacterium]|nr:hypothetical protein [Archangiaceae bacterium]
MVHSGKITRTTLAVAVALLFAGCNCGKNPAKESPRDNGKPCDVDDQCKSELCDVVPHTTERVCIGQCGAKCSSSEVCVNLGINRLGCVPERAGLCERCTDDSACAYPGDRCIAVSGQPRCGRDCSFDGRCPSGYTCENAFTPTGDQVAAQCVPVSGTCECTPSTVGQTVPCERVNSFGRCMGLKTCQQTMYSECMAQLPTAEVCNGIDDDCNGAVDDSLGVMSCGKGECRRTLDLCSDAGTQQACVPGTPVTELCNERDDDCDDVVDNGFDKQRDPLNCGTCGRVCSAPNATSGCDGGACNITQCSTGFGDCNLRYPDGCEIDLSSSDQNCGMCGRSCDRPGTAGRCVNGSCQNTCLPGFVDLDMNPANGCEYACTFVSAADLPDLAFGDANCDGIDGEVGNGIFVSPQGLDGNPGTRAAPKKTVQAGILAAVAGSKRDVYVAAGTYTEQVQMAADKGVYGGYLAADWSRGTANVSSVAGVLTPLAISSANNARVQLMTFIGNTPVGAGQSSYGAWIINSTGVVLEGVTVRAGNGTPGSAGTAGATGASGGAGQVGQPGAEDSDFVCTTNAAPTPGPGGTNGTCGRTGGRGGAPGKAGSTGSDGLPGVGGTPGGSGVPAEQGNIAPGNPYVGSAGSPGAPGGHGTSATGFGSISGAGYALANATAGGSGSHGNGGGGGGGGGGGTVNCDSYGGAGAGGGAGGCGGAFGLAGMSGGAAVAIFLFNASVTATSCTLQTGNGGDGGRGGTGGTGGTGGAGGVASNGAGNEYGNSSEQDDGSNGARGGRGGNGGRGGDGGGGGGGPSIGVLRGGASTWAATAPIYVLGQGGAGGASLGGTGATGVRANVYP